MANVAHSTLTGADLHEPKGIASANSGEVYVANGGGSGAWTAPDPVVFGNKHIAGLTYSNAAGDPTNDITILSGTARDANNTEDMILSTSITKMLNDVWAVGDNQGGLDTGAIANVIYYIWLIKRVDTDVVDVLFSASGTSPTMPANYTKKRRIGAFIRTAGAIETFVTSEIEGGGILHWLNPKSSQTISYGTSSSTRTLSRVPIGYSVGVYGKFSGVSTDVDYAPVGITANSSSAPLVPTSENIFIMLPLNNAGQINNDSSANGSQGFTIYYWHDYRRD